MDIELSNKLAVAREIIGDMDIRLSDLRSVAAYSGLDIEEVKSALAPGRFITIGRIELEDDTQ